MIVLVSRVEAAVSRRAFASCRTCSGSCWPMSVPSCIPRSAVDWAPVIFCRHERAFVSFQDQKSPVRPRRTPCHRRWMCWVDWENSYQLRSCHWCPSVVSHSSGTYEIAATWRDSFASWTQSRAVMEFARSNVDRRDFVLRALWREVAARRSSPSE